MRFHILTLFPNMFTSILAEGIIARAINGGIVNVSLYDIREYTQDRHRTVDDYPFGGGPGMLMKPEPVFRAVESLWERSRVPSDSPVILMTPQGRPFKHSVAKELSSQGDLILICGRYEGFDERIREELATDEISIGDYVLSGGEIAAMVIVDAVSRMIPGVVGAPESIENDSFFSGLLQFPQYTRPASYRGRNVPEILLSGNHSEIEKWRREQAINRTNKRRPDLHNKADSCE
ncbi:MAG: tRNA (guanosine(37)-N1)-methyltransferase TrmD [Candidatus Poseidoniales archaeon]|nr:tRNA (guanosine(37)-N1)-methyltransferase TrmD [Candidatus Poseidoniales archaeon]|tara:strand:- start:357 stop:1058 length:702 start_codon:yes stop_codon:yes gene_type:complete